MYCIVLYCITNSNNCSLTYHQYAEETQTFWKFNSYNPSSIPTTLTDCIKMSKVGSIKQTTIKHFQDRNHHIWYITTTLMFQTSKFASLPLISMKRARYSQSAYKLTFNKHMTSVICFANYHFYAISHNRLFPTICMVSTLACSPYTSRWDYCNSNSQHNTKPTNTFATNKEQNSFGWTKH